MKTKLTLIVKTTLWLFLSSLIIYPSTGIAQGTAFTYQGLLRTTNGLATGLYDFTFTVEQDAISDSPIGSPTSLMAVPVTNGLFTVAIDPGVDVFTGPARWLEICVVTNGGGACNTLSPRQPLLPTPYAIYSGKTMMLDGALPSSQLTGSYTESVTINNPANIFAGDGSGLANVDAATLGGLSAGSFWQLGGNGGTTAGVNFLGTTDNQPLELRADNLRALRLEGGESPNLIGGSLSNLVTAGVGGATIGGGGYAVDLGLIKTDDRNRVTDNYGVVNGGAHNVAGNTNANVGDAQYATVGGGYYNSALGDRSTVGGGSGNIASGRYATVGGGVQNTASGESATVVGGDSDIASGNYAFAAGREAIAAHAGSFVWADSQDALFSSDRNDQFKVRANGGMYLVAGGSGLNPAALRVEPTSGNAVGLYVFQTSSDATAVFENRGTGDQIKAFNAPGSPVFRVDNTGNTFAKSITLTSDRNAKEHFDKVNAADVLQKVVSLPITRWNFKNERIRHVGPMAQDFYAAFGVGPDNRHIATVDADGVALAAIQGLNKKVESGKHEEESEIQTLKDDNEQLKRTVNELRKLVDAMNLKLNGGQR